MDVSILGFPMQKKTDTGIDPAQETLVLKYLLTNEQVQKALTDAKLGNEVASRATLMRTIFDMVTEIYKSRTRAAPEPTITTFDALVDYYMANQIKLGRKSALKDFNTRLSSFEILPSPESATRQIINQGLNSPVNVRPCAELLADLISIGHISSRVLGEAMPSFIANIDDISAHNPAAPDFFLIILAEISASAPAERISNEMLTALIGTLGASALYRFIKQSTGRGRTIAMHHLARLRGVSVSEVERILGAV